MNMYQMFRSECHVTKAETAYRKWLDACGKILGRYVLEGTADESDLFDLFSDGCTPAEAAVELEAAK